MNGNLTDYRHEEGEEGTVLFGDVCVCMCEALPVLGSMLSHTVKGISVVL